MAFFPRYLFQGIGDWGLGTGEETLGASRFEAVTYSLELAKRWKKRCEESSQRFFQEGIMDILCL